MTDPAWPQQLYHQHFSRFILLPDDLLRRAADGLDMNVEDVLQQKSEWNALRNACQNHHSAESVEAFPDLQNAGGPLSRPVFRVLQINKDMVLAQLCDGKDVRGQARLHVQDWHNIEIERVNAKTGRDTLRLIRA